MASSVPWTVYDDPVDSNVVCAVASRIPVATLKYNLLGKILLSNLAVFPDPGAGSDLMGDVLSSVVVMVGLMVMAISVSYHRRGKNTAKKKKKK